MCSNPSRELKMSSLNELAERIAKEMTLGTPNDEDLHNLVQKALTQQDALARLASENEALTKQVADLTARLESIEPFTHLVQYAEGSA